MEKTSRVARGAACAERKQKDINLFDAVVAHLVAEQAAGRSVLLVASSRGAMERLETLLSEHGAPPVQRIESWQAPQQGQGLRIAIIAMDNGFATEALSVLTEQDILGDRMVRRPGRKKAENFLTEPVPDTGDHVVMLNMALAVLRACKPLMSAAHCSCLKLFITAPRLFLPVENIEC